VAVPIQVALDDRLMVPMPARKAIERFMACARDVARAMRHRACRRAARARSTEREIKQDGGGAVVASG
jgi:hypothetical protein